MISNNKHTTYIDWFILITISFWQESISNYVEHAIIILLCYPEKFKRDQTINEYWLQCEQVQEFLLIDIVLT